MKISGYTTTYNCIDMDYPVDLCIESLLSFCDEVCVADGGSTDGTTELIRSKFPEVAIKSFPIDFSNIRWAIQADGKLKDNARKMCSGDILWHADNDEIVDNRQYKEARRVCEIFGNTGLRKVGIVNFKEFWGGLNKLRADVKTRPALSLKSAGFNIGIPYYAERIDEDGNKFCAPFKSDSCQYINNQGMIAEFAQLTNTPLKVWHLSWLDFKRKIKHYKEFWHKFHASMYDLKLDDTAENNVMFNKSWKEVGDKDIDDMCEKLSQYGPRSFHTKQNKWTGAVEYIDKKQIPENIIKWAEDRKIFYED